MDTFGKKKIGSFCKSIKVWTQYSPPEKTNLNE